MDFKTPKFLQAILNKEKARTARECIWTGGEQERKPECDGSAPIPSSSKADWIAGTSIVCSTNRQIPWPLAWLQQHLVSEHLFLKWNVFQLSRGLARSEKILLLFAGCRTCHFLHLYLDGKLCNPLLCMFEQACLDRWQCRNSCLLQELICTALTMPKQSLLTFFLPSMLKQVSACQKRDTWEMARNTGIKIYAIH